MPVLEPIRTEKVGNLEHAITEQIEKLDEELNESITYPKYNTILAKRMLYFNEAIDECMSNLIDKL